LGIEVRAEVSPNTNYLTRASWGENKKAERNKGGGKEKGEKKKREIVTQAKSIIP